MSIFDDSRASYGARAARSMTYAPASVRTEFFNHYDGASPLGLADQPHSSCLARAKSVQAFHMGPSRGWSDTGYQGFVCPHGRAIEGRSLDHAGAHCPNHNTSGYGIQFMLGGNEQPTQAAKDRMRRLYDDLCKRSGRTLAMKGHRDGLATECPGDNVYAWVKDGMPSSGAAPKPGGAQSMPKPQRPSSKPKPAASKGKLTVDGLLGPATYRALQKAVGSPADGIWGPATRRALQRHLGVTVDGIVGRNTNRALQRKVGSPADGIWGRATTKALQRALNKGTF